MQTAQTLHRSRSVPAAAEQPVAPQHEPLWIRDLEASRERRGCIHCHDVKEILREEAQSTGVWKQSDLFRYPPTENVGFSLNIDRGNEVTRIVADSPAEQSGLQTDDLIDSLNGFRVRSIADAQFALDRSPQQGRISIVWQRAGREMTSELNLPADWRRSDISWRPSLQQYVGLPRLYGTDLTAKERKQLGLTPTQLAFRHREKIHRQAQPAGVKPGDIILGFDDRKLDMEAYDFEIYVRRHYVAGDRVTINLIRGGKRLNLPMTILPLY
ncbi:PDZ domain-containing protein [bacterium]|nr:PDZ domain-containing protein [bacterium]